MHGIVWKQLCLAVRTNACFASMSGSPADSRDRQGAEAHGSKVWEGELQVTPEKNQVDRKESTSGKLSS